MTDLGLEILRKMDGAEFVVVLAVIIIAITYLIPKLQDARNIFSHWYKNKRHQEEILEKILQGEKDIEDLKKTDIEYKKALKDLESNLTTAIAHLQATIDEGNNVSEQRYIQQIRSEILDFCNACSVRKYKQEAYQHVMELHSEYMSILRKRGEENGQVSESYQVMVEQYQEHVRNGDFIA